MARFIKKSFKNIKLINKNCPFCDGKSEPDYKDAAVLSKFISERGKISVRTRNGSCNKHQKKLTTAIKRARYMALLPFVVRA